jgi:hypothetical protein
MWRDGLSSTPFWSSILGLLNRYQRVDSVNFGLDYPLIHSPN